MAFIHRDCSLGTLVRAIFPVVPGLFNFSVTATAQICAVPPTSGTPPCVITSQYDNLRDSWNGYETVLTATGLSNGSITLSKPSWSPLAVDTSDLPSGETNNPIYTFLASSFAVPTISNGMIYIPTVDKGLLVYSH